MTKKYRLLEKFLVKFLQDEVLKTGLKSAVVGLSGGIDSAVVAVLAKKAFDDNLLCIMMPSQFSSKESIEDAKELSDKFNMRYEIISIEPMLKAYIDENMSNLRIGNLSARLRMCVLYDISARENALVIGTSNKSELLLGYGTLFGDLASAVNPIGDLYKSEIFEFAEYLGVTKNILDKPPSADLWEGQSDEDDLGFSYNEIDKVLKDFVDDRLSKDELLQKGYDKKLCDLVIKRIYQNHFKRKPPVIAKVSNRSIGHDFLYARDVKL
ncbi:MAG: NAD+ synthase [Epsilonproteobacteria bacterium]|nr:NAD+ synthase [Campylobacterota bacterium]